VPADAGVDEARPGGLDGAGKGHHLVPGGSLGDQIDHRQAVDQDEIRAHSGADPADHLDRQAHPVGIGPAPVILAAVGVGDEELVQEIALRPHHLDAVIASLAGADGGGDHVSDLLLDAGGIQGLGNKRRNRRLQGRGGDAVARIGIATGMEDLHRDAAPSHGPAR
jgi:hypothetical protein